MELIHRAERARLRGSPRALSKNWLISWPAILVVREVSKVSPNSCSSVVLPRPRRLDNGDALARDKSRNRRL